MAQWMDELEQHASLDRIHEYNPSDRNNSYLKLTDNDVVLATYTAVEREYFVPSKNIRKALEEKARQTGETIDNILAEWREDKMKPSYFLHRISWYRVSLDS